MALVAGLALAAWAQIASEEDMREDSRRSKAVCKRHRKELMKTPHVKEVTSEVDGIKGASVLVEVDDPKSVDEVTRKMPSTLEGFPVEVDTVDNFESGDSDKDSDSSTDSDASEAVGGVTFSVEKGFQTVKPAATPDPNSNPSN